MLKKSDNHCIDLNAFYCIVSAVVYLVGKPRKVTFERRGGKSIMLGAYILIKDITKGRRFYSSALRIF